MKHCVLSFLISAGLSLSGFGQATLELEQRAFNVSRPRDAAIDNFLNEFPGLQSLRAAERDMYYWVNLCRRSPQAFAKDYLDPFLELFPELRGSNSQTLRNELLEGVPRDLVAPDPKLLREAQRHATDLAKKQKRLSHSASDGRSFAQRMADAGIVGCAGENVYQGDEDALKALLLLLIDKGVPNLGHRKALLSDRFNIMGVASVGSAEDGYFIVQLFSCK